jgi:hypothetical protein
MSDDILNRLVLYDITDDSLLELLKDGEYVDFEPILVSKFFLKSKPDLVAKLIDLEKRGLLKGGLYKYKITRKGQLIRLYSKKWISFWSFVIGIVSLLLSILFWRLTSVETPESKPELTQPIPSVPQATYDSVLACQTSQKKKLDSLMKILSDKKKK